MKKLTIALLCASLILPSLAFAQSVPVSQMTNDQLRVYLISLIEQVIQLEEQLLAMQNTQTPTAQSPSVTAAPPQPQVILPPAQPQATTTQAPLVAGAPVPQPSGYSIQIIAWPGPVNFGDASGRTYLTDPKAVIDSPGRVETIANASADLGGILMNPNGQAVTDAIMTVLSDEPEQNATINGTGNAYGNPAVPYYPYSYAFRTVGQHTITFTAMGATAQITMTSN